MQRISKVGQSQKKTGGNDGNNNLKNTHERPLSREISQNYSHLENVKQDVDDDEI